MKLCSHCNAQFPDEYSRCIHCDRRLRALRDASAVRHPDLRKLHHLTDEHPAKIAPLLDRLQDAGISFTLITDDGTRSVDFYRGSAGWKAKASVYVEPPDREAAERLHRAFLEEVIPHLAQMDPRGTSPADCCPACHEALGQHADSCPACGLVFPEA